MLKLIKTYNIKCSKISQIIRSFPYIKNKDIIKLSDILIKPFSFITYYPDLKYIKVEQKPS